MAIAMSKRYSSHTDAV